MKYTLRIEKAIKTAATLHKDQFRKDGTPYFSHPYSVAVILSEYTDDEDIIIAGLMHDTIEDVEGYTYEKLKESFGKRVADIVDGVTEEKWRGYKEVPKPERIKMFEELLQRNLDKIERAGPESILVAGADKIHNLSSLIEGTKKDGESYINNFKSNVGQKLRFHRELLMLLRKYHPNLGLANRLETSLNEADEVLKPYIKSVES